MRKSLLFGAIGALVILHQDIWFWNNSYLVFDFVPIGLLYHVGISISAAILWTLVVFYAWPEGLEEE